MAVRACIRQPMSVVARSVNRIYERRDSLHGVKITWRPECSALTAHLTPL